MLSIFVMYSPDRTLPFDYTLACLKRMELYADCQKILVVDGRFQKYLPDWDIVEVPRLNNKFCWGRMWDAGVLNSRFDRVLYLDSDRLLPQSFLKATLEKMTPDSFIFTSLHFQMLKKLKLEDCIRLLEMSDLSQLLTDASTTGSLRFEPRVKEPVHGSSKNVMSGSTGFFKQTYIELGGVDHWYCGHGAFADSDFHYTSARNGCRFVDLQLPELHFPHEKLDSDNQALSQMDLWKASLDNFVYYCHKWSVPQAILVEFARHSGIQKPERYVKQALMNLNDSPRDLAEK